MIEIEYSDFAKIEFKVGKILEVERIEKTDKLYKIQVDLGEEKPTQIVSSLVPYYTEEELLGRKIIVLTNLKPARIGNTDSNGMLLCAEDEEAEKCVLLSPAEDIEPGTSVV